jgi:amino acid transporter
MKISRGVNRFARSQRMAIVNGILVIIILIIILQLWLFTATMNAFLGGDYAILLSAALVSLFCFALIAGLIWYLYALER